VQGKDKATLSLTAAKRRIQLTCVQPDATDGPRFDVDSYLDCISMVNLHLVFHLASAVNDHFVAMYVVLSLGRVSLCDCQCIRTITLERNDL